MRAAAGNTAPGGHQVHVPGKAGAYGRRAYDGLTLVDIIRLPFSFRRR